MMAQIRNQKSPTDPRFINKSYPSWHKLENLKSSNDPTNCHDSTATFPIILDQNDPKS